MAEHADGPMCKNCNHRQNYHAATEPNGPRVGKCYGEHRGSIPGVSCGCSGFVAIGEEASSKPQPASSASE